MRCPNCGSDVTGDSPFCPVCGADLTARVRSRRRLLRNVDRGVRHGAAGVITLMAVISVLAVILSAVPAPVPDGSDPADEQFSPPDDAIRMGDGYILLGGAFSDGSLYASVDKEGYLDISISNEASDDCHTFIWDFRDVAAAQSYMLTKTVSQYPGTASTLEWTHPEYGGWTVTVTCVSDQGRDVLRGTIFYYGDLDETMAWEHGGKMLRMTYGISLSQYLDVSGGDVQRGGDTLRAAAGFVDPQSVSDLESLIWEAYSSAFTLDRSSTDYASCILEFVSSCIETRDDITAFGRTVYWSMPLETVYNGYGDTGDKAVLAASLLEAAGFDAAVVRLPGCWAVGISGCIASSEVPSGSAILSVMSDGEAYLVCGVDQFDGVGVMPEEYGYDDGVTYYGTRVDGSYGALPCTTA